LAVTPLFAAGFAIALFAFRAGLAGLAAFAAGLVGFRCGCECRPESQGGERYCCDEGFHIFRILKFRWILMDSSTFHIGFK
jgi:hypothetical protein